MSTDDSGHDHNPYQAPVLANEGLHQRQQRGMVGQASLVGSLMIMQGLLNLLAGGISIIYAIIMPYVLTQAQQANQSGQPAIPANMGVMFAAGFGTAAVVMLVLGVMWIVSGISITRYQRRTLAIVSLCVGMVTMFTCYCFPTSLFMGVYGMIFLFNQPVMRAFEMRGDGKTVAEIQQQFQSIN